MYLTRARHGLGTHPLCQVDTRQRGLNMYERFVRIYNSSLLRT